MALPVLFTTVLALDRAAKVLPPVGPRVALPAKPVSPKQLAEEIVRLLGQAPKA